jgi:IS5 family transposase
MNAKIPVTDANSSTLSFFMTAGQISDYIGAAALFDESPQARWMLADNGYDADWFRHALEEKGIEPSIQAGNHATIPSNTTSAATGAAITSRSCLAA